MTWRACWLSLLLIAMTCACVCEFRWSKAPKVYSRSASLACSLGPVASVPVRSTSSLRAAYCVHLRASKTRSCKVEAHPTSAVATGCARGLTGHAPAAKNGRTRSKRKHDSDKRVCLVQRSFTWLLTRPRSAQLRGFRSCTVSFIPETCAIGAMAASMPFIMPDGSRLSTLLDRTDVPQRKGRGSNKSKAKRAQPYKHRMELLFDAQDENEASEAAAAGKLGARSKLRWVPL